MAKILIIEDNVMNVEMASELLIKAGHEVLTADNATDGIKIARTQTPEIILMDLGLSGMDGLSATKILKNDPFTRNIKIVAFTASAMKADREKAFGAGCTGFIAKPINIYTFAQIIEKLINSKENQTIFDSFIEEKQQKESKQEDKPLNKISLNTIPGIKSKTKYKWHKVLIVEDNVMNAELLKEILEQIGQSAVIAEKGQKAIELLKEEKFDLILLDIMMPELNGFEVIKILKNNSNTAEIPVIFITALNDIKDIVEGLDLGSYGYITKPYNVEELKARVLGILRIKDLQDELKTEKTKLDLIYRFSADGIIIVNSVFEIVSCNKTFSEWMEKEPLKLQGKNLFSLINTTSSLNQNDKENLCSLNEISIGPSDNQKAIEINCSPINYEENEPEGYILILRDITTQKVIEMQKETFVATLTHDLKTPIRAEIRAMELLLKGSFGELNQDQVEMIQAILHSGRYMFKMVDNLLSTYRYENGCNKLHKESVNIVALIKECYKEIKYIAEDKNQILNFDFESDETLINADVVEIRRVIQNLLSNAVNYTQDNGTITIKTSIEDGKLAVSFTDNGKGIPESQLGEVFKKYKSDAKKFKQVGTGLGLYLSKNIIERHDGQITVKSKEEEGSCFTFFLPCDSLVGITGAD